MKLGAYYWDGWYAKIPHWTDRLLCDFTEREPVWGWLGNTVENMELQIEYAANANLGFFAFDWYYPEHGRINRMNEAVDRYLMAKNAKRMEFCLLVANHSGGFIFPDKWEDACERFMPYLKDEKALKVDGKPVIIFFSSYELQRCLGGADQTVKCLDFLRQKAMENGLKGVCVLGCADPIRNENGDITVDEKRLSEMYGFYASCGLDGFTGYNYHRHIIRRGEEISYIYPYQELARDHETAWDCFAKYSPLPYMPIVIGGWDCRPWETVWEGRDTPNPRSCYSPDRTPSDIYNHICQAKQWIENHPEKSLEDLAIVYAWNENGEGGFIEPTVGDRGKILEAVKKALQ